MILLKLVERKATVEVSEVKSIAWKAWRKASEILRIGLFRMALY